MPAVVMLVRYPRRGEVKTRIGAVLGEDVALDLHDRLARHTLRVALELQTSRDARVEVRCDAAFVRAAREWLGAGPRYRYQGEGDLGDRIVLAFARTYASAKSKVLVIGGDCAALTADHLRRALQKLDEFDCVIGPSKDGGYYLIGLAPSARATALPVLFRDMPWGTSDVLVQTLHTAANAGLTVALLDELPDVDLPADIPAAERLLASAQASRPRGAAPRGWRRWFAGPPPITSRLGDTVTHGHEPDDHSR
jgi:hypothetical protein